MSAIFRIVSGGQTGADRAALDAAIERGVPCGGWCPRGRLAEDGPLSIRYPLQETPLSDYAQRTEWNVRDSDGTLLLTPGKPTGGTRLTLVLALRMGKPVLVQAPLKSHVGEIVAWVQVNNIKVLNVAGPRESHCPGIYGQVREVLSLVLKNKGGNL